MRRAARLRPLRPLRPLRLLALLSWLPACELTEVSVVPGQRVVIVQSVLNLTPGPFVVEPGLEQFVVVEYSQVGDTTAFAETEVPPGEPRRPISDALVTIENGGRAPCAGHVDTLVELPSHWVGRAGSGSYHGFWTCMPRAGDRLLLRVETPAGEVVTGGLSVPGASTREVTVVGPRVAGSFDRERDTLRIGVTPVSGRALQLEVRNAFELDRLPFFAFTDTMGLTIPGNLVNPFEGDSGESIFRAGRYYRLAVALTDSNYYDYLRSRSDPFTGRGFINHLSGGIGVFGAVETAPYGLRVVAPVDDAREGVYRIEGTIDTGPLTLTLEVYLDDVQRDRFSAFVTYQSLGSFMELSGDGGFATDGSGRMDAHFRVRSATDTSSSATHSLTGIRPVGGAPFPVILTSFLSDRSQQVDTLTAQQISGPGLATASPRR